MSGSFGPMKLDFSSFYKFVSSVGLVLIAASVSLPWFILRIFAPEAPSGTRAAKVVDAALEERANQYLFIIQIYPWASLILFLSGCLLTGYGLTAWRNRQKKQDDDEDELYRQRRELGKTTQASDDDREEKLNREASGDSELLGDASERKHGAPPRSESHTAVPKVPNSRTSYQARRGIIRDAERQIGELLDQAFNDSHSVETGVRVGDKHSPILDFVARARDASRWSSFAIELNLALPVSECVAWVRRRGRRRGCRRALGEDGGAETTRSSTQGPPWNLPVLAALLLM